VRVAGLVVFLARSFGRFGVAHKKNSSWYLETAHREP
jgi:hypothetical protein